MNEQNQPLPVAEAMRQRRPAGTARAPRARPYLRLLWLIPGLALLGAGLYTYYDVEDDGVVHTVQVTTKAGPVGQAAEAMRLIQTGNPDLYLKVKTAAPAELRTDTYKNTPIGNGLKWPVKSPLRMREVREVEIWDSNVWRDDFIDRVSLGGWSAEGQLFRVELMGEKLRPPDWALPVAAVGGVITLFALMRFVWDQVI